MQTAKAYIGGRWVAAAHPDQVLDVVDPSTGLVIGSIPKGSPDDVDAAAAAAGAAQPAWERLGAGERATLVKEAARRVRAASQELAAMQSAEGGKPLGDSEGGVLAGAGALEQYGELGPLHRGRSLQGGWGATDAMVHVPYGVAALLVPWNDPLAITGGLLGAALAAGNTVVLKPSEKTPLSSARLVELFDHLPPGVINLVLGDGAAGAALVEHPLVDLVVHVGSVRTGRAIAERCAALGKKAVLELGGKDPLIVDEGVDPAWAASQAALGAFANCGQICTSVERIYVHRSVAEAFLTELVREAERRVVGPPTDEATTMGPLVDEAQRAKVDSHVQDAVASGATVLTGGRPAPGPGFFYPPTVLTDVGDDMVVFQEETFGPVAAVRVVDSFEEALVAANGTEFGLAATVLTTSQEHAQQAMRELRVGTVKINAVFGGAPGGAASPHKASGQGFGYGPELLDEVTRTRVVHYGLPGRGPAPG
ncbi:MAG: Aldehyde dehydrogenase [uncultured Acidimicrobiales bacterium]|uniref:Aldehyde dehydrogenase n=1 Tax=uncultured Acidimicrobiales bacterium TaxID=310071 RepID=A0A6J4HPN3_9ACTN|nr:MAG: Aldehyde dehydrogenase [uncultured Acidimicrobiales bacterium]